MSAKRPPTAEPLRSKNCRAAGIVLLLGVALLAPPVSRSSRAGSGSADDSRRPFVLEPESARECDLDAIASASTAADDPASRILLGLSAYACGDSARAVDLLAPRGDREADLEDWRLFALAEASADLGEGLIATRAVEELLLEHPASPLRHQAYVRGALVARESGEVERALSLARASRAASFPPALRTQLDVLAWEAAVELGRAIDIQEESRYLLLNSPIDAFELDVDQALAGPDGEIAWSEQFEPAELLHRASLLIDSDLRDEALVALDALPEAHRGLDWRLLKARALTEDRQGAEALELLNEARAVDVSSGLDIHWLRAMAAFDAATARQGRTNLSSSQRSQMRLLARGHLRAIVNRGGDSAQAVQALERLFEELADGEHFEEVLSILARLKAIDPGDYSGARYLFGLGWNQYERRNYSGAIGYWRELIDLYPDSKRARAGKYWSARAHEAIANRPRANTLYEQIASAATIDYYSKYALERLGREEEARVAGRGNAEPWPRDPSLSRAELLSDAGLDALGLEEAQLLEDVAERRASLALKARILARQGRRRDSIQHLWRAFPSLGSSEQSRVPEDALRMYYPLDFHDIIKQSARDASIPPSLLFAMIRQESAFDVSARSWAGARGLMQVMPATARELAQRLGLPYSVDRLNDPAYSVKLGSSYFRQVLDMFDGEIELALAGYNAGPYRIRKLVRNAGSTIELDRFMEGLPIEESKTYVRRVVLFSNSYARLYPELG